MSTLEKLIDRLKTMDEDAIARILDSLDPLPGEITSERPDRPCCGGNKVIRYGECEAGRSNPYWSALSVSESAEYSQFITGRN